MSAISFQPSSAIEAIVLNQSSKKRKRNDFIGSVGFIPADVMPKLQELIKNQEIPKQKKKKAFTILSSYSGNTIAQIKELLIQEDYTPIGIRRIASIISVFNLRIKEPGFIDRFLNENMDDLRNELLDEPLYKRPKFPVRKLNIDELEILNSVVKYSQNSKLIDIAKLIVALSNGLINRQIKQTIGFFICPTEIADIRLRLFNQESIQSILGIPNWVPPIVDFTLLNTLQSIEIKSLSELPPLPSVEPIAEELPRANLSTLQSIELEPLSELPSLPSVDQPISEELPRTNLSSPFNPENVELLMHFASLQGNCHKSNAEAIPSAAEIGNFSGLLAAVETVRYN